jgi:ribosomal protein S18 acetylase RimI-like enzyme
MSSIRTRLASIDDLAAVAPLFDSYRQFYQQDADPALATSFIGTRLSMNESVILLAEDEAGKAVGFCQLYPTFCSVAAARIYVLYDLFVAPSARQLGAGRALMLAAEEHARKNGVARMDLSTAKTNLPAQALYESLGWVRDEVFYVYNRKIHG